MDFCEICSNQGVQNFAVHIYIHNHLRKHKYCDLHFKEFCKMVVEEK